MATGTPISDKVREQILIEWRQGVLCQRDIANKYKVSPAAVNKICKGVTRDLSGVVNQYIEVRQQLNQLSEQEVNAVGATVDTIVSRLEWLNEQALRNVKEAMDAECENQSDFRSRALTINAAKETLVGKTPETAIQINNQNGGDRVQEIRRTIVDPRHTDSESIPPATETGEV